MSRQPTPPPRPHPIEGSRVLVSGGTSGVGLAAAVQFARAGAARIVLVGRDVQRGERARADVAAHGLEIRHAIVRGPMLPGIVSLWEPVDGPAKGIPYIVFAGNVGDDQSLADVTRKLSNTF